MIPTQGPHPPAHHFIFQILQLCFPHDAPLSRTKPVNVFSQKVNLKQPDNEAPLQEQEKQLEDRLAMLAEHLRRAKKKSELSMTSAQQLQQRISMAASQLESIAITGGGAAGGTDDSRRNSSDDASSLGAPPGAVAPTGTASRPHTAHVSLAAIDGDISQV